MCSQIVCDFNMVNGSSRLHQHWYMGWLYNDGDSYGFKVYSIMDLRPCIH